LSKTSSSPRWALAAAFAELFLCSDEDLPEKAEKWRRRLFPGALARLAAVQEGIAEGKKDEVLVTLPNRRTRILSPGESSVVSKAVIEQFAPLYLKKPGVVWLSESSRKEEAADLRLAMLVRLDISESRILPDIILVHLRGENPRFVFVGVVSTDGPIDDQRKADLTALLEQGGHSVDDASFVTAFLHWHKEEFRRLSSQIAWNSFEICRIRGCLRESRS
jgi:hypothetical protein